MQFGSEKNIKSVDQITDAFNAAKKEGRDSVAILIHRRGGQSFTVFRIK